MEPRAKSRTLPTNVSRQRPTRIRLTACRAARWTAIAIVVGSSSVHRLDAWESAQKGIVVDALGAFNAVPQIGITMAKPA